MKNIQYVFIEGQTPFGLPRGVLMSFSLNALEQVPSIQIQTLSPSMYHRRK